jgi:predicted  nucleic acid-binding Zn-ribbon protein
VLYSTAILLCLGITSAHSYEGDDIVADIDELTTNIRTVNDRRNDVLNSINRISIKISELNQKANQAVSLKNSVNAQTADLHHQIADLDQQIGEHNARKASYDKSRETVKANQGPVRSEITSLGNDIFNLNGRIDLRNKDLRDLAELSTKLTKLEIKVDSLNAQASQVQVIISNSIDSHTEWMESFKAHVTASEPDWDSVVDITTYKTQYGRVNDFWQFAPSQSQIDTFNGALKINAERISGFQLDIVEDLREIPLLSGINLVKTHESDAILLQMKTLDENLEYQYDQVMQSLEIPLTLRERRSTLLFSIYNSWLRLLGAKLSSANIIDASELINQINQDVSGLNTYTATRVKLTSVKSGLTKYLRTYYAPRLSKRKAAVSLRMLSDMRTNLNNSSISGVIKSDISDLLIDYDRSFQSTYNTSQAALANEQKYYDQRISRVSTYIDRYSDRMTDTCIEIGNDYLVSAEIGIQHEKGYMEFRTSCL